MKNIIVLVLMASLIACEQSADTWQGYVEADTVFIAAPVEGKLHSLQVQEGDQVEAEQILFALDPEPHATALVAAVARADAAAAELADLQKGSRPEELAVIDARYAQVKAATDLSAQQLNRIRSLVQRKLEGQEALDEITTKHELNLKQLDEVEAQLNSARLAARTDRVKAAEARLRAAEAEVKTIEWQIQEKSQAATQQAKVQDILFRPGEFVAAGQPVLSLLPPSQTKVRFFVPETQLVDIKTGQTINIYCDGCAEPIPANIHYISPQAEYTPPFIYSKDNRQKFVYLVEARPALNDAEKLRPGQPVDVQTVGSPQ